MNAEMDISEALRCVQYALATGVSRNDRNCHPAQPVHVQRRPISDHYGYLTQTCLTASTHAPPTLYCNNFVISSQLEQGFVSLPNQIAIASLTRT